MSGSPRRTATDRSDPNGGRTNGGKHWATPWGKPTKGKKTRSNKSTNKFIVRSRHDRKKSQ